MDRRDFLSTGAGTAMALAVATAAAPAEGAPLLHDAASAATLGRTRFEAWLHSEFRVRPIGCLRSARATLVAVVDGPQATGLDQFAVIFRSADRAPTGLCELRHDDGTALHLHLDDGGRDGTAVLARATFSLIASA